MTHHPPSRQRPRRAPPYRAFSGVIAAGALVLAACASTPTRFFTLDAVAPGAAPAVAYTGPPVKVLAVHIPPALDRDELVSETGAGEMKVHDFEHWEAPLGLTARQTLVEDLAGRLPAGAVLGPSSPGGDGVATVSADVVSFQAGPQGATLQVGWSVTLPAVPGALEPAVYSAPLAELSAPVSGEGGAATAAAFSALLGQLSDRIAATLPEQIERLRMQQMQAQAATRAAVQVRSTTRTTSATTAVNR